MSLGCIGESSLARAFFVVLAGGMLGGCTAANMAGRAASTTIGVAADVTAATVRGAGKVAAAAVSASGEVADESIRVASKLSKSGLVVFFDPKTGSTWEAPVKEGMKLLAASELAKVDVALKAARIIRSGKALQVVDAAAKLLVKSGDVIEMIRG